MKKVIQLLVILNFAFLIHNSKAQAPQAIAFQAVARDTSGNLLANETIAIRFSILDNSPTGTIVYRERHVTTTDELGLFNVNIGQGTVENGNFGTIAWSIGNKYLQIEIDINGGTSYTNISTQQMLSVPYALSSGNSWSLTGNAASGSNFLGTTNSLDFNLRTNNIERLRVLGSNGYVGIGTIDPVAPFHVSGGNTFNGDVAVFEDVDNAYLHLLTENIGISGLFFGTTVNPYKAGILFNSSNIFAGGLSFNTGGNIPRMTISSTGYVGIGTISPLVPLHVRKGSSGASMTSSDIAVFEDDDDTYLRMLTPSSKESGLLFGNNDGITKSGITFNSSIVSEGLSFRTGGASVKMVLTSAGRLGIGTLAPAENLDVVGNVKISGDIALAGKIAGNLNVDGEVRTPATGSANMLPIAYGNIFEDGTINYGSGNFTCTWDSQDSEYKILINGETDHSNYVVLVTPTVYYRKAIGRGLGNYISVQFNDGIPLVYLQNYFNFVVFKK